MKRFELEKLEMLPRQKKKVWTLAWIIIIGAVAAFAYTIFLLLNIEDMEASTVWLWFAIVFGIILAAVIPSAVMFSKEMKKIRAEAEISKELKNEETK